MKTIPGVVTWKLPAAEQEHSDVFLYTGLSGPCTGESPAAERTQDLDFLLSLPLGTAASSHIHSLFHQRNSPNSKTRKK